MAGQGMDENHFSLWKENLRCGNPRNNSVRLEEQPGVRLPGVHTVACEIFQDDMVEVAVVALGGHLKMSTKTVCGQAFA